MQKHFSSIISFHNLKTKKGESQSQVIYLTPLILLLSCHCERSEAISLLNPPLQKGETKRLPLLKGDREGFEKGKKKKEGLAPLGHPRKGDGK